MITREMRARQSDRQHVYLSLFCCPRLRYLVAFCIPKELHRKPGRGREGGSGDHRVRETHVWVLLLSVPFDLFFS